MDTGSLVAKTMQFLEGTTSYLLGSLGVETTLFLDGVGSLLVRAVGKENCTKAKRLSY